MPWAQEARVPPRASGRGIAELLEVVRGVLLAVGKAHTPAQPLLVAAVGKDGLGPLHGPRNCRGGVWAEIHGEPLADVHDQRRPHRGGVREAVAGLPGQQRDVQCVLGAAAVLTAGAVRTGLAVCGYRDRDRRRLEISASDAVFPQFILHQRSLLAHLFQELIRIRGHRVLQPRVAA
eukprot:CAMPEP_0174364502 /NCGR_PEP_ID=MMETSP0811_2-20130205/73163_1 /TAXON_ID=73025 ORGANISM="Eutreptiella gymnastica-like, Strain CCMP1594" /NCGR_SAMPLE_ID=MMETSP0811_2 /ASSEMBLY_ACC=CAM_ASM_000667 /LENGTH=176 /DNA_ID=CAMNT_0015504189 /DNA_START=629 /DNA_END=1160 /DNA_ORIENTATION=+